MAHREVQSPGFPCTSRSHIPSRVVPSPPGTCVGIRQHRLGQGNGHPHQTHSICYSQLALNTVRELHARLLSFGRILCLQDQNRPQVESTKDRRTKTNLHRALHYPYYSISSAFSPLSELNALEDLARSYATPAEEWEHVLPHLKEIFQQYPSQHTAEALGIVHSAGGNAVGHLLRDAPALSSEWLACRAALVDFEAKLAMFLLVKHVVGKKDLSQTSSITPTSSGRASAISISISADAAGSEWACDQNFQDLQSVGWMHAPSDGNFIDNQVKASVPRIDEMTAGSAWDEPSCTRLTGAVVPALYAWIYYGQILAPSFGVYVRVFAMLSCYGISAEEAFGMELGFEG